MNQPTFQSFVERRLNERPNPSSIDTRDPRYFIGAGEVMLDILLAAATPTSSDAVLQKIEGDIARGDALARVGKGLLNIWAMKKSTGDTSSLGERDVPVDEVEVMVTAYRMLTLMYVGAGDVDRISTLAAVLNVEAGHGHRLASALKVMLDAAMADLTGLAQGAVDRATADSSSTSSPTRPSATAAQGGCYVASAVYGSYDCPEVWVLRRFRDQSLAAHGLGRACIRAYYALSPAMVSILGSHEWFSALLRPPLDRFVARLRRAGFSASPYDDALAS